MALQEIKSIVEKKIRDLEDRSEKSYCSPEMEIIKDKLKIMKNQLRKSNIF